MRAGMDLGRDLVCIDGFNSEDEIWYAERLGAEKGIYEEWFFCVVWSLAETLDGIAKPGPVASTPLFAIGRIFQL